MAFVREESGPATRRPWTLIRGGRDGEPKAPSRRDADLALAARIAGGDEAALADLYNQYSGPLTGFVSHWLGDPNDASDIVHETFIDVWRKADRFAGRASLKSWIYTIARNKAVDRNRRAVRTVYTDTPPEMIDTGADASVSLEALDDASAVRAAMDTLKPAHRAAIHLAFFEDLSYKEIAEIEGCPVGTVKTRVLHAKRLLMHALSDHARG